MSRKKSMILKGSPISPGLVEGVIHVHLNLLGPIDAPVGIEEKMVEEEKFDGIDFSEEKLKGEKYDECIFLNCNFSNVHLTEKTFVDCVFEGCDFSNCTFGNTGFREVQFKTCKMLGLHFEDCNPFLLAFEFKDCQLDYSSFCGMKIPKTKFKGCRLLEVDFTDCDLQESVFENCDLTKITFVNTLLQSTDFRTSYGFSFDPSQNHVSKAKFSKHNITGLLTKFNIEIEE